MSDPVTNVEIEDVLSSIRRLVSQDDRSVAAIPVGPAPDAAALVLTQDHRVTDEPQDGAAEPAEKSVTRLELERAIAELEEAVGVDASAQEPALHFGPVGADSSEQPQDTDDAPFVEAPMIEMEDSENPLAEVVDIEEPEVLFPEPVEDRDDPALAPSAQDIIAEVVAAGAIEVAADAQPVEVENDDFVQDPRGDDQTESWADTHHDPEPVAVADAELPMSDYSSDDPAYLNATGHVDPSQPDDEDVTASPFVARVAQPVEDASNDAVQTVEHDHISQLDDALAEQVIDEDMLRDLVADIVREELQGELGERITRNVRKLVRREINRALAGQDLV